MSNFGYAEGVALGMASADAHAAQRRAFHAENDLGKERARRQELERENEQLKAKLAQYEKAYGDVYQDAVDNARQATAGLVVMNGMVAALDNLPAHFKNKFLDEVVELSRNRFQVLDQKYIQEAQRLGIQPTTIEGIFSKQTEYQKLGFNRSL